MMKVWHVASLISAVAGLVGGGYGIKRMTTETVVNKVLQSTDYACDEVQASETVRACEQRYDYHDRAWAEVTKEPNPPEPDYRSNCEDSPYSLCIWSSRIPIFTRCTTGDTRWAVKCWTEDEVDLHPLVVETR